MKPAPTDAEAAAIAVVMSRYAAIQPHICETQPPSGWLEAARRDAVITNVPNTWRG